MRISFIIEEKQPSNSGIGERKLPCGGGELNICRKRKGKKNI